MGRGSDSPNTSIMRGRSAQMVSLTLIAVDLWSGLIDRFAYQYDVLASRCLRMDHQMEGASGMHGLCSTLIGVHPSTVTSSITLNSSLFYISCLPEA